MADPDAIRKWFKDTQKRIWDLNMKLARIELPSYWDNPTCACPGDEQDLRVVTDNYTQFCNCEADSENRTFNAWTDGWDDMDEGGLAWVECMNCHTVWTVPTEIEWN